MAIDSITSIIQQFGSDDFKSLDPLISVSCHALIQRISCSNLIIVMLVQRCTCMPVCDEILPAANREHGLCHDLSQPASLRHQGVRKNVSVGGYVSFDFDCFGS